MSGLLVSLSKLIYCCRNNSTFPRLAEPLGFVGKDDIFHVVKAIVATQRDYGRRDDRKQSRLKYLVDSWGIDKFRLVVQQYYGKAIQPFRYPLMQICILQFMT